MKYNEKEHEQKTPKCSIYNFGYVEEQKQRRKEEITNPESNKVVLFKNVSIRESEQEIKETLEELGFTNGQIPEMMTFFQQFAIAFQQQQDNLDVFEKELKEARKVSHLEFT
ncbi:hypothetical protein RFI_03820 [Reticulomyxa filosa]|uniref:Uncharacterized protein n=1 Tax=Reticulomyxa filosa TaxID=46433 RepID=X6P592_RETFI|nr:hypothetical protein RFI_03820 [Reticulomyxa filosa]|eukprot:ETO33288.1 hypothetical protein RFI_03820 [Reticulomyxa filosa]